MLTRLFFYHVLYIISIKYNLNKFIKTDAEKCGPITRFLEEKTTKLLDVHPNFTSYFLS